MHTGHGLRGTALPDLGSCAACRNSHVCLPRTLEGGELQTVSDLTELKRRIPAGAALFHAGDSLSAVYAVHSGTFKSVSVSRQGLEKVTGFHFPGELLGLDAIGRGVHRSHAFALEASQICVVPYEGLLQLARMMPALQHELMCALSNDISRDDGLVLLMGIMSADQRLAGFLLGLSLRLQRLGYAPDRFVLRMTRVDIASYLGLTSETVSRTIWRFVRDGLIEVDRREVRLLDCARLKDTV